MVDNLAMRGLDARTLMPHPGRSIPVVDGDMAFLSAPRGRMIRPHPQSRSLGFFNEAANMLITGNATLAEEALVDADYPNAGGGTTRPVMTSTGAGSAVVLPAGVIGSPQNIVGGVLQFLIQAMANTYPNLTGLELQVHSAGTPAAPTANYHAVSLFGKFGNMFAKDTSACFRPLGISAPVSTLTAVGNGADLTAVLFTAIKPSFSTANTKLGFSGSVLYHPNMLTKGAAMIAHADGTTDQWLACAQLLAKYNLRGCFDCSPAAQAGSGRITDAQYKMLHDMGHEIITQAWSTEDDGPINAMTHNQRTAEVAMTRNWHKALGMGGDHAAYFSNINLRNAAYYKALRQHVSTARNYIAGAGSGTPIPVPETMPPGDNMAIIMLGADQIGGYASGDGFNAHLKLHFDQAITHKAFAGVVWHNGIAVAAAWKTVYEDMCKYLDANRALIQTITPEDFTYRAYLL